VDSSEDYIGYKQGKHVLCYNFVLRVSLGGGFIVE